MWWVYLELKAKQMIRMLVTRMQSRKSLLWPEFPFIPHEKTARYWWKTVKSKIWLNEWLDWKGQFASSNGKHTLLSSRKHPTVLIACILAIAIQYYGYCYVNGCWYWPASELMQSDESHSLNLTKDKKFSEPNGETKPSKLEANLQNVTKWPIDLQPIPSVTDKRVDGRMSKGYACLFPLGSTQITWHDMVGRHTCWAHRHMRSHIHICKPDLVGWQALERVQFAQFAPSTSLFHAWLGLSANFEEEIDLH